MTVEMMPFVLACLIIGAAAGIGVYEFILLPSTAQVEKVKEWLLYAVIEAEKYFGGGTGKLKLRYAYDMFVTRFPKVAKVISFEMFSKLVDESLEEMRKLLHQNSDINKYVEG